MKIALLLILFGLGWAGWRAWQTGPLPVPGAKAPDFSLPDQDGNIRTLASYSGRWLVLYFYPRDDTPGCTREACAFRDGLHKLAAVGATVAGISVDSRESHRRFAGKHGLPFPLLADSDGGVARRYGVLMDWGLFRMAKRVTFLIGPDGIIRRVYPDVDPRLHADQVLSDIR
jgi:thioredoxin-dependent peroxiredoxin